MKENTLFCLVGCPGAGKSFWSQQYCLTHNIIRLSSDELRGVLTGDETCQDANKEVFHVIHTMVEYFLKNGQDVLVDATNVSEKARRPLEYIARKCGARVQYFVFERSIEELKTNNQSRERTVPDFVIDKMVGNFIMPIAEEGFSAVTMIERWGSYRLNIDKSADSDKTVTINLFEHENQK